MANYVDGFLVPVPKKDVDKYKRVARKAAKVWREHGALEVHECQGDDVPRGKVTSFTRAVDLKRGEVVFFSWIVYKSRAQRDRVNKKVMEDPRIKEMMGDEMVGAPERMIFGGFKTVVEE